MLISAWEVKSFILLAGLLGMDFDLTHLNSYLIEISLTLTE